MDEFYRWFWNTLYNALGFAYAHCFTCQRFWYPAERLGGRPICLWNTWAKKRLTEYNEEGKLWVPEAGVYRPLACGRWWEKGT